MSNPTITIITTPNGGHRWIANSDEEVAHFSLPGQGHKIEIYTRVAPTEAAAMAATVPAGWQVVPMLPTEAMIQAGAFENTTTTDTYQGEVEVSIGNGAALRVYHEMLKAAPQAPVADQPAEPSPADLLCYLKNLTIGTFNRHYAHDETYASGQAIWTPCDDMAGLLTQLDNMLTGLSRAPVADQPAEPSPASLSPVAGEMELIEKAVKRVGIESLLNHGAASCVYSEGCCGVTQAHLLAYTREIALHCAVTLAAPKGDSNG